MSTSDSTRSVVPPPSFRRFAERFPDVVEAYDRFGEALRRAGPLSAREAALVKLAVSVGARMEGATYAHARKARAAGIEDAAIEHVALLSAPTIGFPNMMAALGCIRDVLAETGDTPGRP
jgi:alkylhydroperoxidase/carboxymuconolactone decarboxylase family protein YurZ